MPGTGVRTVNETNVPATVELSFYGGTDNMQANPDVLEGNTREGGRTEYGRRLARKRGWWVGEEVALLTRRVWEACAETEHQKELKGPTTDYLGVGEPWRRGSSMWKTEGGVMTYKRQNLAVWNLVGHVKGLSFY